MNDEESIWYFQPGYDIIFTYDFPFLQTTNLLYDVMKYSVWVVLNKLVPDDAAEGQKYHLI